MSEVWKSYNSSSQMRLLGGTPHIYILDPWSYYISKNSPFNNTGAAAEAKTHIIYINEKYLNLHSSLWWSVSCECWVKPLWRVPETTKEWRNPPFNFQKRIRIGGTRNNTMAEWSAVESCCQWSAWEENPGWIEPRAQQASPLSSPLSDI